MTDRARIEAARPSDEQRIRRCVHEAYRVYLDRMTTPPAPMLDDYRTLIAAGRLSVAVDDSDLLGVIVLWAEPDHLYVDNVAVDPSAQGRGVGRLLLGYAECEARALGRGEVRLYTNEAMTENLSFYASMGFVETHRGVEDGYRRVYFRRTVPETSAPIGRSDGARGGIGTNSDLG